MQNSLTPERARCDAAGAAAQDAGCVGAAPEAGQAAATPKAGPASAGCAATPATDQASPKATPPQTVREFERALRELGFTRLQAASIARQGFSGIAAAEIEPSESESLRDALQQLARTLESSP